MIPYGRHSISQADIDAVVEVLRSDFITQGPTVPRFEQAVARYCGAAHAVAVNSATSALHLACLALDVRAGDSVWTSAITFVASANCARYCNATVDFVDIDSRTYNLSPEALEAKLVAAERKGRLPKVVIPVHLGGHPCDGAAIYALGRRYGFRIIEDAAHALGARYRGEPVGDCRYSDISVFSFHAVKNITTGEGGVALTNQIDLAERMGRLRTHGITRDPSKMTGQPKGPWTYEQIDLGFNYRMTDIQAALGLSQLQRVDGFIARRNELARRYDDAFTDLPIQYQCISGEAYSARHLYLARVQSNQRPRIYEELRDNGIGVSVHYAPVHLQPYYRRLGFREGQFPQAEEYSREAITLPLFAAMTDEQHELAINAVQNSANFGN